MKRSIIAAFSAAASEQEGAAAPAPPERLPTRMPAGVIGATARSVTDIREERDELKKRLEQAGGAQLLDTDLIDPSPFPDRLPDAGDADFATLKRLIEDEGQKIAIQVRKHPREAGRFQIVFGHRRWRAAKELRRSVRAEIVQASDEELAIAQGIENSARQDLSWIERALFAWRLESSGIKAKSIRAALAVDDAELARFRSVCRSVPTDIIELIGRAPRIGRPRWVELASAVGANADAIKTIRRSLSADKVLPSDERFRLALGDLQDARPSAAHPVELKQPDGRTLGRLLAKGGELRISVEKAHSEAFSSFLQAEMPDLVARFFASRDADT